MTAIEPATRLPDLDEGDHERMAHLVVPASAATEAMITGKPCTALCGKVWVPTRDPDRYDLCGTCSDVMEELKAAFRG